MQSDDMLWLVEMPWITANMAGVNYVLLAGSKESVRNSMWNWVKEENCYPPYNESVRVYEVRIEEDGDAQAFGIPATANNDRDIALIEEKMGEDHERFAILTNPNNIWGTFGKTLDELAPFKKGEHWVTLRLVTKYSWTFADMLP